MPAAAVGPESEGTGSEGAVRDAFIRRAVRAIERLAVRADDVTLAEALASPTDLGALARVLTAIGAVDPATEELDPEAGDLVREIAARQEIVVRAGRMLSADQTGRLLGISRQAVDKRRRKGALLALRQAGDWLYPRCQFHDHEAVPDLNSVLMEFEGSSPWVALEFLVTPDAILDGRSPRDALLQGTEMRSRVGALVRGHASGEGFA